MTDGTSTTATRSREAQAYLDGVGAALADLPEEERADLLDELATHLDELAAEGDTPLTVRLGSPQEYAAELRASAGLPPARARGRAGGELLATARAQLRRPLVVSTRDFLTSLRPAWWVLRGWIVGAVVAHLTTSSQWDYSFSVVPGGTVGFWGTLLAVFVSVQIGRGRWAVSSPGWRRGVIAANIVAAVALLPILGSLSDASGRGVYYAGDPAPQIIEQPPAEGVYAGGEQVWNIYPYDASGRLLHDVRLYDQTGASLSLGLSFDPTKQQTLDSAGRKVDNAFPYRYLDPSTGDVTDPEAGPPVAAPRLLGVPTETPTPSPSATPSAGPTGGKR